MAINDIIIICIGILALLAFIFAVSSDTTYINPNSINTSFIFSKFSATGADIRGDPWYFTTGIQSTGEMEAPAFKVNNTEGYTGTCVNITYKGGVAVSCND